jgi:hypothetical protein
MLMMDFSDEMPRIQQQKQQDQQRWNAFVVQQSL